MEYKIPWQLKPHESRLWKWCLWRTGMIFVEIDADEFMEIHRGRKVDVTMYFS